MSEQNEQGSPVGGDGPVEAPVIAAEQGPSKTPWALVVGGLLAVAVIVGGVWFTSSDSTDVAAVDPTEEVVEGDDVEADDNSEGEARLDEEVGDDSDEIAQSSAEDAAEQAEEDAMAEAEFAVTEAADSYGYGYDGAGQIVFDGNMFVRIGLSRSCLLYTSPSPRDS